MLHKSRVQAAWDLVGAPFRLVLFDQAWLPRFRWTTLEAERFGAVRPWIQGRLLDIGAGENRLVKQYGNGVGVDVVEWGGGAMVVADTSRLDFPDASFGTVTMVACLNHIPNRDAVVREARRLVPTGGRLVITMINPILGEIGHRLWWYSEDKHRDVAEGEVGGMWNHVIVRMCRDAGFRLLAHERFVYAMNNLFVFEAV